MGLRFDPVGGGQFKQAVKQIIEAESQPIKQLENRKKTEESRLKLFQEFKGKFSGIQKALQDLSGFSKFRELKVELGDAADFITVTVDKDRAPTGTYSLEVEQLAARTAVMTTGYESPDESQFGLGFITMNLPDGTTSEIYIEEENASLNGIARMINGDEKSPIRASVIKDASSPDAPWKLLLSAKNPGEKNQIEFPQFYFMDGKKDLDLEQDQPATNAVIKLDGIPIELENNLATDFLTGVNLTLKQARPGRPLSFTISEDQQKIAGKVKTMVDQLNSILEFITKQNTVDAKTDTRSTFAGDTGLQTIEYRIRNLLHEGFPVGVPNSDEFRLVFTNEIGIEFDKGGQLQFKEDKFKKFLEKDYNAIAEAITGPMGMAVQMKAAIESFTAPNTGFLSTREVGIRNRIKEFDRQIDDKQKAIERRQQSLTDQFSRLEATLGSLQRQSQYLAASMPAGGAAGSIASLLGG
jgi:flagellar hook-associated protein 2